MKTSNMKRFSTFLVAGVILSSTACGDDSIQQSEHPVTMETPTGNQISVQDIPIPGRSSVTCILVEWHETGISCNWEGWDRENAPTPPTTTTTIGLGR